MSLIQEIALIRYEIEQLQIQIDAIVKTLQEKSN